MRILHVNKYLYRRGGAEGYMLDVAELQAGRGAEVAFWGMDHPETPVQRYGSQLAPYLELEPPPSGLVPAAVAAGRTLWSETSRRRLAAVLDDFQPDVAHLHNIYHHLSPSILQALKRRGVPMVMTLHDYKLACPSYHFLAGNDICTKCLDGHFRHAVQTRCMGSLAASALVAVESRVHRTLGLYDPINVLVSPSRFLADQMRTAGVYPERLEVLGNPADVASFPLKEQPGGPVFFMGRLAHEKGVDTLVRAMGLLPGARLEVAGDGPDREKLEALAQEVAPGRITFHGRLDKQDLLRLLRSATVAAVPSRWHENMPMAVLEALGSGVPVVATDLGGLPDLVDDGVDGALVPHEDPAALAQALGSFLADPERSFRMGRAGRAKAETSFDPTVHVDRLFEVYGRAREAALAAGGRRRAAGAQG